MWNDLMHLGFWSTLNSDPTAAPGKFFFHLSTDWNNIALETVGHQ